ncbi:CDP-2,3-bis-(O-geranylgeranyl)-sn-glycerol synthase [Halorhabdus sp. CBA1104]|uniref:CDP-2,3-bis-(O-geranylgeranyl)-sn-glycerol synthase n=1 Tax=Halorhabdus sp. CBA1104 TaxID=1380432 RepID=UPI0012B38328|nr:CDP-2,3-bis-(O-geranylgeranyl)-sn-glycerol synthase [Halorhabdus sp. CBA1104]QGN07340.1 CDP-2,3-bis-(O-geranylgeranyl)-sn-glycerol synthase [Halorhabdus sp. CBA1104]
MSWLSVVVVAVWAMLPAYVPNNAAVLAGGGRPIDGGRTLGGARALGDGKTWRGTAAGTAAGVGLALILDRIGPTVAAVIGVDVPGFPLFAALALAFGAMVGDIAASFIKRRLDRERGAPVPGLDQLDFVVGALALAALFVPTWFADTFTPGVLLVVVLLTPLLHLSTNAIAYGLGLKDEPY